jgi:hypothetical protein
MMAVLCRNMRSIVYTTLFYGVRVTELISAKHNALVFVKNSVGY